MLSIRRMTAADLPHGLLLSRQASWNQTEADWRRLLDLQPDGCFIAEWEGNPAGTTITCTFGPVAWVAMVLVEESLRGRGIGRALMLHALEFLDRRDIATVRLDATPLGRPLYERLGFVEQYRLARYEGILPPAPPAPGCREVLAGQGEALAALDEAVTRTNRREFLHRLFAEQPGNVRWVEEKDGPGGFLAARPGARAIQIGPCITGPEAGPLLLADAWHRYGGQRAFLDVPIPNEPAARLAEAQGLTVQRYLTRMCRGEPLCERVEWLWASSGPEKG